MQRLTQKQVDNQLKNLVQFVEEWDAHLDVIRAEHGENSPVFWRNYDMRHALITAVRALSGEDTECERCKYLDSNSR